MAPKRKRVTHCTTCGESLELSVCAIDWHAVWVALRVKEHMTETGRIPTHKELMDMDEGTGSDPCDDCCCGACGSRKVEAGAECC
jgi:hypothetical protein